MHERDDVADVAKHGVFIPGLARFFVAECEVEKQVKMRAVLYFGPLIIFSSIYQKDLSDWSQEIRRPNDAVHISL